MDVSLATRINDILNFVFTLMIVFYDVSVGRVSLISVG